MAVTLTHNFVSAVPQGADASKVRTNDWNDEHAHNIDAEIAAAVAAEAGIRSAADTALSALIDAAEIRARRAGFYVPFTPTGVDDEFDDGSFTGWTLVNDGVTVPTNVETAGVDRLSVMHPGGGAVGRLCSYMKAQTPGTNSTIEIGFSMAGRSQSVNLCGLIFADGNTYAAGNQVVFYFNPQGSTWERVSFTNYNTAGAGATFTSPTRAYPRILLLRFKYEGSNNFSGWTSGDGQQWSNITGTFARTLSPTHVGFFVTTYGGAQPHNFCFDYFRYIA